MLPKVNFAVPIPAYANTVGRAVHVKIYPKPRNLAESREVLRVLQQYGEIIMYKHCKVFNSKAAGLLDPTLNVTAQWLIVVAA